VTRLAPRIVPQAGVERISAAAFTIPTDGPEADGTLSWDATTIVIAEAAAGGEIGLGYTYGDPACAAVVERILAPTVAGTDAMDVRGAWAAMNRAVRNLGRPGVGMMAIAAVDTALWDLKARLLGLPLVRLLGRVRDAVPAYGSGGFTSYSDDRLCEQLAGWVEAGMSRVKMKVGSQPSRDAERVAAARRAVGGEAELFVDANGAYSRKQALALAERFAESRVGWFEEPVSSDDLDGLRLLAGRVPAGMAIAAGEYGHDLTYFRRMLAAGAVDVLQADATRCGGVTGFADVAALCAAHSLPLSAHTAPSLHAHVCSALEPVVHVEYFHDHARVERLLFDGAATPVDGRLRPDAAAPGHGLELRRTDAERFRVA
jgi:L-alanine-DL-glutamate epimerase-like enolase superfamily enzyme